jgi:hypothetical protein
MNIVATVFLCPYGSVAEHFLGKEEVSSSILLMGSTLVELDLKN